MFTSILSSSSVSSLTVTSVLLTSLTAIALGIVIAAVYMKCTDAYTKNFIITLALLPVLVQAIILMTSGSLGSAVAVAGAFSLVRFRSAPGTAKEILGIFFSMAAGLACGMGQILFAALITVMISLLLFVLSKTPFGGSPKAEKQLRVTIPEELDYTTIFDDIFARYTSKVSLDRVKTVNLGSLYELVYSITLKDEKEEKKMLDEIRIRNGNLTVICGRKSDNIPVL